MQSEAARQRLRLRAIRKIDRAQFYQIPVSREHYLQQRNPENQNRDVVKELLIWRNA